MSATIRTILRDAAGERPPGRPRVLWIRSDRDEADPDEALSDGLPPQGTAASRLLHERIDAGIPRGPVEPILPFLRGAYASLPREEGRALLKRARFPSSQRILFERWALEGRAADPDVVPFADGSIRYERYAWFSSLARLFVLLSGDGPLVYVIHEAQRASQGLIRFLEALSAAQEREPVTIVLIARADREWHGPAHLDRLSAFLSHLDDQGCFLSDGIEIGGPSAPAHAAPEALPGALPEPELQAIEAMKVLHCHEDALAALEAGHPASEEEEAAHELLRGECWALLGDSSRAGLHIDETIDRLERPEERLRALLLACRTAGWKRQQDRARRCLADAWTTVAALRDPAAEVQCLLHEFFINDLFGTDPDLLAMAERIKAAAEPLKLRNVVGYIDSDVSIYLKLEENLGWDEAVSRASAAMERAARQGNAYRRSVLSHVLGVLHERKGAEGKALEHFMEGIRLRKRLGDPVELIKLYNGTGYYCFTIGKFKIALDYFARSLRLLGRLSDFQEACLTLCNMAQTNFYSGRFRASLALLDSILEVMDILGYPGLPFHRRSKLEAMAAACAWHLGRLSRAMELARSIRQEDIDADARPYVVLAKILLECVACDEEEVMRRFDEGLAAAQGARLDFLQMHILATKGIYLSRRDSTHARRFIMDAWGMATSRKLDEQASWLRSVLEGTVHEEAYGEALPSALRALIQGLRSSALQEAAGKRLLSALNQIQFLQRFQTAVHSGLARQDVLALATELLEEHLRPMRVRIHPSPSGPLGDAAFEPRVQLGDQDLGLEIDPGPGPGSDLDAEELRILGLALSHLSLILKLAQEN